MSADNQDKSVTSDEDTIRVGTFIETRGATNNSESAPPPGDEDVMRTGLHVDTRAAVGKVGNETVPGDGQRDNT